MAIIKLTFVNKPGGDWTTLYLDDERVCEAHTVESGPIECTLEKLGHTVTSDYKELTEACDEQYDGCTLPDDINKLSLI